MCVAPRFEHRVCVAHNKPKIQHFLLTVNFVKVAHNFGSVVEVLCSSSFLSYNYCSPVSLGGGDEKHELPNMVMTTPGTR